MSARSPRERLALRALLGRWLVTGELPPAPDEALASLLAEVAREQGLAGLLHQAIGEQRARWPDAARMALRRAEQEDFAFGVRQLDTASRVQDLLGARGVRCLPLKGAALAERLYDSVAHRPMADVDLLVLDEWSRAVTLLEEAGFTEQGQADHARAFLDPASGTVVELHRGVTSCARLFPLDLDATWRRSRRGAGLMKQVPSSEDLLVHLSLHAAFQHGLVLRVVQFLDFRRLLEREPPDPVLLAQVATSARAQGAVALALEAARAIVAAPVSRGLQELITAWLPISLRRYLASKLRADPSALLRPAEPALAWVRWQLAEGRRIALVRETIRPSLSSFSSPTGHGVAVRALGLARRWTLPTLRSLTAWAAPQRRPGH
ncbi:MAG: nucleotidyltransferase family protein [Candidatus Rokuibacteriota bacterium]